MVRKLRRSAEESLSLFTFSNSKSKKSWLRNNLTVERKKCKRLKMRKKSWFVVMNTSNMHSSPI